MINSTYRGGRYVFKCCQNMVKARLSFTRFAEPGVLDQGRVMYQDNRDKVEWVGKSWGKNISWWRSLEFTYAMESIVGHRMVEGPYDDEN